MTNSNYGFILITKENAAKYEPRTAADERLSSDGSWIKGVPYYEKFYNGYTYRRPIPPGEGWEIVPAGEFITNDCEKTIDGLTWYKRDTFIKQNSPYTWRRPITKPVTPPSDFDDSYNRLIERSVGAMAIAEGEEGWEKLPIDCPMLQAVYNLRREFDYLQKLSDWQPISKDGELNLPKEKDYPVWVTDGEVVGESNKSYVHYGNSHSGFPHSHLPLISKITHWQSIPRKPAPPTPPPVEKTVAERCFKAWLDARPLGQFGEMEAIKFALDWVKKEVK